MFLERRVPRQISTRSSESICTYETKPQSDALSRVSHRIRLQASYPVIVKMDEICICCLVGAEGEWLMVASR